MNFVENGDVQDWFTGHPKGYNYNNISYLFKGIWVPNALALFLRINVRIRRIHS